MLIHIYFILAKRYNYLLLLLNLSPNYLGLATFVLNRHLSRFFTSPTHTLAAFISFSILSNHLFFGLHLPIFPSTFILITTLSAFVFSHLITCPNHLSLLSLILSTIDAIHQYYLLHICSLFYILSSLHLSI